ncbi:MAG: hypothetical protein ACK5MO_22680 [Planctomyces sp.]|jgi:hypothetical protein
MLTPVLLPADHLVRFGLTFDRGGAHLARSMMLDELTLLLQAVTSPNATLENYHHAVIHENCLAKRSSKTRQLTLRHLKSLYSLDPDAAIFRAMRFFWQRDTDARGLLAFLVAYSRDSILRSSAPFVMQLSIGETVRCPQLEAFLDQQNEGRFSKETLRAASQRILASWARAGHLIGHVSRTRIKAKPTAGSCAMALFLSYLSGARGQLLFATEYIRLLDCSIDHSIELAESASRRGWIVFKRIGNVMEVQFPGLLTKHEQEWIHEQG